MSLISNELVKKEEYNIYILSIEDTYKDIFFSFDNRIKISKLKKNHKINHKINYILNISKIRKYMKKNKIDVVIDVDVILDILTLPAILGLKTKLISWEHFNLKENLKSSRRRLAMKLAVKFSDYIVTLTSKDKEDYKKILGRKKKIISISNPMEEKKYEEILLKKKQIISVGKLLPIKGYDLLIDVAKDVFDKKSEWKWIIIGDGSERDNIEELIEKNNLQNKVSLLGKINNVDKYYEESSIFVLPSRNEGFGIVILEAKKHKLPVVCFDIETGAKDLVRNNINGFRIEKYNTKEMAEKIKLLMYNDELRDNFSKNARLDLEKYNINSIIEKWENLIKNLIKGK